MSYIGSFVKRVFGHSTDQSIRNAAGQSPSTQLQGET